MKIQVDWCTRKQTNKKYHTRSDNNVHEYVICQNEYVINVNVKP